MIDSKNINSVFDAKVVDQDNAKIGTVKQVYVDDNDGRPLFVSVATGLFGMSESFVPLDDAALDGDELRVRFAKDKVKDAPRIDAGDELSDPQQDQIWDYYFGQTRHTAGREGQPGKGQAAGVDQGTRQGDSHSDEAMTRSEERLHVGKETVPTGRARLRKHVVTEQQNVTVPVQHEEVRVEREPITDANIDEAVSGQDLADDEHDVTLHEERVSVDKETVPVEQVRLDKERVTEQENVSEELAHEEIDLENENPDRR